MSRAERLRFCRSLYAFLRTRVSGGDYDSRNAALMRVNDRA
jgi:hypothetical protein